jgi:hypothetical protein
MDKELTGVEVARQISEIKGKPINYYNLDTGENFKVDASGKKTAVSEEAKRWHASLFGSGEATLDERKQHDIDVWVDMLKARAFEAWEAECRALDELKLHVSGNGTAEELANLAAKLGITSMQLQAFVRERTKAVQM